MKTSPGLKAFEISKWRDEVFEQLPDLVVREEPFEIRIGYGPENDRQQLSLAVVMRTPGNDEELTLGFLTSEGIIHDLRDVLSCKPCRDEKTNELSENIYRVELAPHVEIEAIDHQRRFFASSSCGICGKGSIEQVNALCKNVSISEGLTVSAEMVSSFFHKLKDDQLLFKHTGGLHASVLIDREGKTLATREDAGRHNALDKIIGFAQLKQWLPLSECILLVSGRSGFEIVQKAAVAGISIIVGLGAPSSLAVELARDMGITLIGFLKEDKFNIYAHPKRITS
jgi:FdhD protein